MFKSFIHNRSIKMRFLTTFLTNVARMGFSFISGIIVARGLGPTNFGNYNFLLTSFVAITGLLDLGTSSAFYTFISQRKRDKLFYTYYSLWLFAQFFLVILFVGFLFPDIWINKIWLGQARSLILLAFLASFLMDKLWKMVTLVGESMRSTIIVQIYTVILTAVYLGAVLLLYLFKFIGVGNLFLSIALIYLIFSVLLAKKLKGEAIVNTAKEDNLSSVLKEFKIYCVPLILYSVVSFMYSFADNWLLQNFGGAVQQGFYSVGLRFSNVSLVLTASMLSIFWKEIAETYKDGKKERLYYLYNRTAKSLCFISCVGGCFLFPFAKEILAFILGPAYVKGWPAVAIMFLFPIPQSIGQINGIYFYAIGHTKLYSKISIIMMIVSMPITYFMLAPASNIVPGLGLGSVGIALKMVIIIMIWVNVYSYFISKLSGWKFEFLYQLKSLFSLLTVSFIIKMIMNSIFSLSHIVLNPLFIMALCVPAYLLVVAAILYIFPGLAGLDRAYIRDNIILLKGRLKW